MKNIRKIASIVLTLALFISMSASGIFTVDTNAATVESWVKVTDWSTLQAGDQIVIVYDKNASDSACIVMNNTLNTDKSNHFMEPMDATISNGELNFNDNMGVVTLENGSTSNSFRLKVNGKYLSCSKDANAVTLVTATSNQTDWKFVNNSNKQRIQNVGYSERYLQYNASSPRFATYKTSSNMQDVDIYKYTVTNVGDMIDSNEEYIDLGVRSVVPDDKLYLRYYFSLGAKATGNVTEYGIEYWDHEPTLGTDEPSVLNTYGTANGSKYFCLGGLAPHEMLNVQYYRIYIIMDGTKYSSEVQSFSLQMYHDLAIQAGVMTEGDALDELVDAAIAYGTAAKNYRNSQAS